MRNDDGALQNYTRDLVKEDDDSIKSIIYHISDIEAPIGMVPKAISEYIYNNIPTPLVDGYVQLAYDNFHGKYFITLSVTSISWILRHLERKLLMTGNWEWFRVCEERKEKFSSSGFKVLQNAGSGSGDESTESESDKDGALERNEKDITA